MASIDHTHDPQLRSWVAEADRHPDFPIQNLPLGVFSPLAGAPRGGVAIGDHILDLRAVAEAGLLDEEAQAAALACVGPTLNPLLEMGAQARLALRDAVSAMLSEGSDQRPHLLHRQADCMMYMPAQVGDYTDFYAGIHHATNVGRLFRPDSPLLPNYKWVPIAYHGRASSLGVSGAEVRRPSGQRKPASEPLPSFGPSRNLDYELELGIWVGRGNALGAPISIKDASNHIAGYCLLNDWSARDVQGWEYQPLGPFLAKNFRTTVSPWVITPEALAPFRTAQPRRPEGDPRPMDYLLDEADQMRGALELQLEVLIDTVRMREAGLAPHRLSIASATNLYWTPAQMLTHHASGGCNLQAGDLFGTGTISAATPDGYGSLLEITEGGKKPVELPSGETRRFLEDGDEVILRARTHGGEDRVAIGFGECRGRVLPAV